MQSRLILVFSLLLFLVTCVPGRVEGQFAVAAGYKSLDSQWQGLMEDNGAKLNNQLIGGSLFYWFRLPDKRIEFNPEIGLYTTLAQDDGAIKTDLTTLTLAFNTDIYLLDIINDCDCPTFSKEGTFFKRGFFIEATIGADYEWLQVEGDQNESYPTSTAFQPIAGAGLGLDIGVSDMVTITPIAYFRWKPTSYWESLGEVLGVEKNEVSGSDWYKGLALRVSFRPDYRRRFR